MDSFKESLAYWTTILGTIVAFFGLVQSFTWLAGVGALLVTVSVGTVVYARQQHRLLRAAAHRIEGRSIDSLNAAALRRGFNRTLVLQTATNIATIRGQDLRVQWDCSGYCRAQRASAMEFSIDTDNNIPFDEFQCEAYDLAHDPDGRHQIRPVLLGPDGTSKKIVVPFLKPIRAKEAFEIRLDYELPGCMKPGLDYYTASLSFVQDRVPHYEAKIVFERDKPQWVRVYESAPDGSSRLLRDLPPESEDDQHAVYRDIADDVSAQSARIYLFRRSYTHRRAA